MNPASTANGTDVSVEAATSQGGGSVPPTAVPVNGPAAMRAPVSTLRWSTGLCHCLDDPANSLVTFFCPCITFGLMAETVDKGNPSSCSSGCLYGVLMFLTGLACLFSCHYRSKLRSQYDLPEEPCMDCLVHFCCEACALCQEYRELKNPGYDVSIGWEANMERQWRTVTVAPIAATGMTRSTDAP